MEVNSGIWINFIQFSKSSIPEDWPAGPEDCMPTSVSLAAPTSVDSVDIGVVTLRVSLEASENRQKTKSYNLLFLILMQFANYLTAEWN